MLLLAGILLWRIIRGRGVARRVAIGLSIAIAVAIACAGCDGGSEQIKQEVAKTIRHMRQSRNAYDVGYAAGQEAARAKLESWRARSNIGWGFVVGLVAGLCLVAMLNARRIEDALSRRRARRGSTQLVGVASLRLDPEVRDLADMLAGRHTRLKERIHAERSPARRRFLAQVQADVDALVGRAVHMLSVLQELNDGMREASTGRTRSGVSSQAGKSDMWRDSVRRAEADMAQCKAKLWATIDAIDSITLRLAGLKLASLDAGAISKMAAEINSQIESVEQAYKSLALDAPPRRARVVNRPRETTPPRQSARPR